MGVQELNKTLEAAVNEQSKEQGIDRRTMLRIVAGRRKVKSHMFRIICLKSVASPGLRYFSEASRSEQPNRGLPRLMHSFLHKNCGDGMGSQE